MTLSRRRVYVLPTRAGVTFALVLVAMLLGAVNYANSLAFALTFLLGSLAVVSMIHTVRNLYGLVFTAGHARGVFAGETANFPIAIENPGRITRLGVSLELPNQGALLADVAGGSTHWVELRLPAERRGRLRLPRCTASTRFPLGLFHAWGYLRLDMDCAVYPRPAGQRGLGPLVSAQAGQGAEHGPGVDDFASLRNYHPGDSLRHIHWKAAARGQGLLTKQFGGEVSRELWIDWETTPGRGTEERLSQLCLWVLEADEQGLAYGLGLPGLRIDPGRGDGHRRRCLEALARFGEQP